MNRRSGSSLDYIFALQESAEFEPTKGSRKRATYLYDQDSKGSDRQTERIHRGTNKYDPLSTQTSMTRKRTSSTDLTPRGSNSREEKQVAPPNVGRRTATTGMNGVRKRPESSRVIEARSSREEIASVKPPVRSRQFTGVRKAVNRPGSREKVSSTTVAPSPSPSRSYSRGRTQGTNEKRPATTRKTFSSQRKAKEITEPLEDENYPEAFKALIKSRNKNNDNRNEASSPSKPSQSFVKSKFPTRSRKTRERTSTTSTTAAPSLQNGQKSQKFTRNEIKKVLFPTRKSSPRTTSTTEPIPVNIYDNENFIEPTQPSPDFNYHVKYDEPEEIISNTQYPSVQNTLKSPFLTKNKASIDPFTKGPGYKQVSAPYDSSITVSALYYCF